MKYESCEADWGTRMEWNRGKLFTRIYLNLTLILLIRSSRAWTGEIHGRVVCDVCGDSTVGPEDHVLEGNLSYHSISVASFLSFQILFCFDANLFQASVDRTGWNST